jgi:hypothetical protein
VENSYAWDPDEVHFRSRCGGSAFDLDGEPAPIAPQAQASWMTLSMLSPAGATAFAGAAAAAQPVYPPPPPRAYDRLPPPPIPVILVVLATLLTMIYIATRDDNHGVPTPNSPA